MAEAQTPETIWSDDRFGRKIEAELLIAYIESASARPSLREDLRALTIAVDSGYGEGKSFFLKRLAKHLSLSHPVAFVDAWADDVADEPGTALAATLQEALSPLLAKSPQIKEKWKKLLETTGEVTKIALAGLAKRGLGLIFTSAAVSAVEELVNASADLKETFEEAVKASGDQVVQGLEHAIKRVDPNTLIKDRIDEFVRGRAAMRAMRESLEALVASLDGHHLHAPIVIVIDELDRCRPTYAIKLLEEVKHLFDVPGLVFVFGMHRAQLAHAVRGVYGSDFSGDHYLRRFIGRTYRLRTPDLTPLISQLFAAQGIEDARFEFPEVLSEGGGFGPLPTAEIVGRYMKAFGASARDAFHVADMLQTSLSLTGQQRLLGAYFIPLIISRALGATSGNLLPMVHEGAAATYVWHDRTGQKHEVRFHRVAESFQRVAALSYRDLQSAISSAGNDFAPERLNQAREAAAAARMPLANPANYAELIETVGRFRNPQLAG